MSLFIGVCPSCTEEVVFNKPTDSVVCGAGHKGAAPEAYREATEEEREVTCPTCARVATIEWDDNNGWFVWLSEAAP